MKKAGFFFSLILVALPAGFAQTALDYQKQANTAFAREDYLGAIEAWRSALAINPAWLEAKEGLAEAFFYLGEYDEAYSLVQEAARLGKFNPEVNVLWGRTLLAQGKLDEGLAKFDEVLKAQPRHLGALFGRAEYQVMMGHSQQALKLLEAIHRSAPASLRALLSMMLLYSDLRQDENWAETRARAMELHSSDDKVHLFSALHFAKIGNTAKAFEAVDNFLKLTRSEKTPALLLKTRLFITDKRYSDALTLLENEVFKTAANKKSSVAWYLRGLAARALDQVERAQESFDQAVRLDKDNEVYRIVWENLYLNRQGTLENPQRLNLGKFHFGKAATWMEKNVLSSALDEYRRGLMVNPFDPAARLARAQLFKIQGFETTYLEELEFIAATVPNFDNRDFQDQLEIARNRFLDSLPVRWKYDLRSLGSLDDRVTQNFSRPFSLGIYYIPGDSDMAAFASTDDLARFLTAELASLRSLEPAAVPLAVGSPNEAFRKARDLGQDFYLLLSLREGNRSFSVSAKVFLGRTGRQVQSFAVYKKGLGMVAGGLRETANLLASWFPWRGAVIQRQGQTALVNLGRKDGVAKDAQFTVLKEGALTLTGDQGWFKYLPADVLGTIKISALDDKISEGTFEKAGFFDTMAVRDEVLLLRDPPKQAPPPSIPPSTELQRQILNLR